MRRRERLRQARKPFHQSQAPAFEAALAPRCPSPLPVLPPEPTQRKLGQPACEGACNKRPGQALMDVRLGRPEAHPFSTIQGAQSWPRLALPSVHHSSRRPAPSSTDFFHPAHFDDAKNLCAMSPSPHDCSDSSGEQEKGSKSVNFQFFSHSIDPAPVDIDSKPCQI